MRRRSTRIEAIAQELGIDCDFCGWTDICSSRRAMTRTCLRRSSRRRGERTSRSHGSIGRRSRTTKPARVCVSAAGAISPVQVPCGGCGGDHQWRRAHLCQQPCGQGRGRRDSEREGRRLHSACASDRGGDQLADQRHGGYPYEAGAVHDVRHRRARAARDGRRCAVLGHGRRVSLRAFAANRELERGSV